jgi:hypothetical protein
MVREQVQTQMLVAQVHASPDSIAQLDHRMRRAKRCWQRTTFVVKGSTAPGGRRPPEGLPKPTRAYRQSIFAMMVSSALKGPKLRTAGDPRSARRLFQSSTTAQIGLCCSMDDPLQDALARQRREQSLSTLSTVAKGCYSQRFLLGKSR